MKMQIIGLILIILGVLLGLSGIAFKIFWRKIPLVHIGIITIKGERKDPIYKNPPFFKKEGWRFFVDFFPFFYGFELIKVEKVTKTFIFENIRCRLSDEDKAKSGGEITVKIGVVWQPDYKHDHGRRLSSYIDSKKQEGVEDIIHQMVEEDIRQMGRDKTWEDFTFATDALVVSLVRKLTGQEPKSEREINKLSLEMQTNGFPDIADLGIIIWRFNVGQIKEQGELAKAADGQAIEIQERRKEIFETQTELEQAKILYREYKEIDEIKTLDDCTLEIRRRKAIREGHGAVYDIQGLENLRSIIGGKNG